MNFFKKSFTKRCLALFLSVIMIVSNMEMITATEVQTSENGVIQIDSAEELAKIGVDENYPMTGDYVLGADIDLSDSTWTPLGGYIGTKGTMNPADANVFSGTFDGQGHVISGLSIDLDGSIDGTDVYAQVGLFSVIAGRSAEDYAVVENLIFTDVDIKTDFSNGYASVGTLAGDVNGYSKVDCVVVLDGKLTVNMSGTCDTVGVGGLIGECRTSDTTVGNNNISITNCYNGAMITASGIQANSENDENYIYTGGIIGRVAKSACKEISSCLNVGIVQFDGYNGYAIAAAEGLKAEYLSTLSDCYYHKDYEPRTIGDGASALSQKKLVSGELPNGLSADIWKANKGCYMVPSICYASSIAELLYLTGYSLAFAEDESAEAFKTTIDLPAEIEGIAVTWTSSNENAVSIENGQAVANTYKIGEDTTVQLTATTSGNKSKVYTITVISAIEQAASFDAAYAKVGTPLNVVINGMSEDAVYEYTWTVDDVDIQNNSSSYTPAKEDLESFICVKIKDTTNDLSWELSTYFSELPVVYINTADGSGIDSNIAYEDGSIKVQGNDEFTGGIYYDGAAELKGRGNSTWSQAVGWGVKRPYKIKLDKKANLLGLGDKANKHWALLANMIDHTNMRNELVKDFADDIGMTYMNTTGVVLILNGQYEGMYELCEHKRIAEDRINVFDWEGLAGDIAEAAAEKDDTIDEDDLKDAMEQDFSWIDGDFVFDGRTLLLSDYWDEEIPEFTGGFFLDMDFRSSDGANPDKYISPFTSSNGIPLFVDGPEYAITSDTMMTYVKDYINAYEAAIQSENYTTSYNGENVHYTDLFDMDSLVQYWLVCEYTNNWDSMKNSTLVYKDLDEKAKMGPIWDYDWAFGNINMYGMTGPFVVDDWHTTLTQAGHTFCEQPYQARQWNHYLVTDPYFVTKAYEAYKEARTGILEETIKDGGLIDTLEAKYQTAADKNDEKWSYSYSFSRYNGYAYVDGEKVFTQSQTYNDAVESLKTFITKRVEWLDAQFESIDTLYASLGNTVSNKITVTQTIGEAGEDTIATATVSDENIANVEFIMNGTSIGIIPVTEGVAEVAITDAYLEADGTVRNTLQVLALDASGNYIADTTNFSNFTKTVAARFDGSVSIKGTAKVGEMLTAEIKDAAGEVITDEAVLSTFTYQWYANGEAVSGANIANYFLTENEVGKKITVVISSSEPEGTAVSDATSAVAQADEPEIPIPPNPGEDEDEGGSPPVTPTPGEGEGDKDGGSSETPTVTPTPNPDEGEDDTQKVPTTDIPAQDINQTVKVASITISAKKDVLQVKETVQLTASIMPQNATQQTVTWNSSNTSVATVSATGLVTAKKAGKAVISATATDGSGVSSTFSVVVQKPSIKVTGKSSVKRKKTITLKVTTLGVSGKLKVTLDKKGKKLLTIKKVTKNKVILKAKNKKGTAKVTIKCGKYKTTKKIKVK